MRYRTHIITTGGQQAYMSWERLAQQLQWTDAKSLEAFCIKRFEIAIDNQGLDQINIFALLRETQQSSGGKPNLEASLLAVDNATLVNQATMTLNE